MKAIRRMTNSELKAFNIPIRHQIAEHMRMLCLHLASTHLWNMHVNEGHGIKRLERDLENYKRLLNELKSFYEIESSDDITYVCLKGLQDIGFDISKLENLFDIEYSINGRKGKDAKWSRK